MEQESALQNLGSRTARFLNASARQLAWKGEPSCSADAGQAQRGHKEGGGRNKAERRRPYCNCLHAARCLDEEQHSPEGLAVRGLKGFSGQKVS